MRSVKVKIKKEWKSKQKIKIINTEQMNNKYQRKRMKSNQSKLFVFICLKITEKLNQ